MQTATKIATIDEFLPVREQYRADSKRVVWTNGCFDLFHAGHVLSLASARALGDVLVVGLNSDASVKRLKGPSRPLCPQDARATVLAALETVDHVVVFDGERCTPELTAIQPDVYAQGAQYTMETIDPSERAAVEAYGGEFAFLPMQDGVSTSLIQKRILRNDPEKITSAAFALIQDEQDRLLLVATRYLEGVRWGLPGGGHHRGERLADTVIRECREETGLAVTPTRYRGVIERWAPEVNLHLILHMYECEITGGELCTMNEGEDILDVAWWDAERIRAFGGHILGRKHFLSYIADPDGFPYYTYMGPGEE